ncbi:SusC/RagA family TonB-linked outer membrane protein [Gillisia limnaea]|uniref:TonB-dependent receptor plug n=1 Tax=Gillisia limnaea (strain DSM 15749 / LMG 21470 / R-8282) TaxID=865937 RepID=H2BZE0_GILLR|nr:SusC/RagA family TonB-linked outer membrane protein [Gillisia limnaea]EHQ02303.1 TonB-dependent receptor plug [Gillisia limnaea DSM 15749]
MKKRLNGILTLFLVFMVQLTFAQQMEVSGTVTDENGLPLPGVNVLVDGSARGVQTDFDGNYAISVNQGGVLVFSFIGMETARYTVGEVSLINVTLAADASQLDEVVVTAFGIKRNPKDLGYSVSTVAAEDVTENSEPDLIRSLAGKVAGVQVNISTGVAGASNQINIRGVTSIQGSSQPLIVVDGIAYSNDQVSTSSQTTGGGGYESGLSTLDPNNIESINVLKSTAAAALYGSRATNGVIVITTKTGAGGGPQKTNITVTSGTYLENIANLPDYQNTYGAGVNFAYANANGSWGPRFDSRETIPTWPNLLNAFPDQFGSTVPYEAQPDNVKDLFKTGVTSENSVNLSYGGENGNFGVTVSDLSQEGYIPFNTYDRNTISAGGNFVLENGINFGGNLSYSDSEQVGGFFGENQFGGSSSSFARTMVLARNWDFSLPYIHPETGASVIPNAGYDHPLWSWENDQIITNTNRTVANVNAGYDFNEHISASFQVGVNKYSLDRKQIREIGSRASEGLGSITLDRFVNEDVESTFILNFDKYQITEDIGFSAILGNNMLQNTNERSLVSGNTFISPGIYTIENNVNVAYTKGLGYERSRTIGVFAEVGFSFRDYLFVNATGRNDWSSTLPEDNNSYFYPSVSSSLILTEALNLQSDVLTFAKIRGAFASVARSASAEFLNRTFAVGQPYNGIPVIGNRTDLADQELTPEFTDEIEAGIDLEFWNRRIALDFTWYEKVTTDLISPVDVPRTSGFTTLNTNIGEIKNTGIEVGLTLVPFQTEDFKWTLFTNFTQNKNEVTELVEGLDRIPLNVNEIGYVAVGQPFGVFYGSQFARDDEGNFLINRSGGGIVADLENGIIGDPNPDFRMSFINTISYKGVTLNAQVDWKEGGDIQSSTIESLLGRGVTRDTEDRERTFIIPGFYADGSGNPILDPEGNQIPNSTQLSMNELYFSPAGGNTFAINSVDEASVYDGTVYRLREVSLGYEIPAKWLERSPFGRISLSAVANNLWYFAPNVPEYTNFDPEVTAFGNTRLQGIEIQSAPTSKRYGIRISASF